MVGPPGEQLRLSYPESGAPFRYEAGPQPSVSPFTGLTPQEVEQAVGVSPVAGEYQQHDISRFEPEMPQNRGQGTYDPLAPPGPPRPLGSPAPPPLAYGEPGAPPFGPYHGAVGETVIGPGGTPVYHPAEEMGVTPPDQVTYAVRAGPPGSYVDHLFATQAEAEAYAQSLAGMGESYIRDTSALPYAWPGTATNPPSPGNPVDMIRVFEVPPSTVFLRSGVAPQPESQPGSTPTSYPGGGPQIQLPYGSIPKGAVPLAEFPVTSPPPPGSPGPGPGAIPGPTPGGTSGTTPGGTP